MVLIAEQGGQPLLLAVGEQVGAGVQGAAGAVERVGAAAAVAVQVLLDPTPAAVQASPASRTTWKGSSTAVVSGSWWRS